MIICDICNVVSEEQSSAPGEFTLLKHDKVTEIRLSFNKTVIDFHICHICTKKITGKEWTDDSVGSEIIKKVVKVLQSTI